MGGPGSGRRKGSKNKHKIKSELGYAEKIWSTQGKNTLNINNKRKTWGKTNLTANEIKKVESYVRKLWEYRNGR